MDQEVKMEAEEEMEDPSKTITSKRKKKPTLEKREMALKLKIKKCVSQTTMKNVISDNGGKCKSSKKRNASAATKCTMLKSQAMIRAEEVQSNLEASFPTFAKSMVRSHVGSCFWMGLPGLFCKSHLPNEDTTIVLEDESGRQYETKYIADKTGLSAGWRQFVGGHNLVEGDVLVFQLVKPTKFKVYIIRSHDFTEVDGALGLLTLDANTKSATDLETPRCNNSERKRLKSFPPGFVKKRNKKPVQPNSAPRFGHPAERSKNDDEESVSESSEGFKLSVPTIPFKDIDGLENFTIVVHGSVIDSEISEDIRDKYYRLCSSQNAYLHENLNHSINSKLIAGTISETVNIADAIRNCKLATSRDKLISWDKTLMALELLGMNVGFLRARLHRVISLAYESEIGAEARRYIEAKTARTHTEDVIRNLEERLTELKRDYVKSGADIEALKSKAESHELKFLEEVSAPW